MTQVSLNVSDKRDVFLLISQIFQQEKKESIALEYLVKYFDSFPINEFSESALEILSVAVINAIKSSIISYSHRYLLYKSVSKHTFTNSNLNSLIQLLQILVEGNIEGFQTYESNSDNSNVMKLHSITPEHISHSLKLLILCNLASKISLQNNSNNTNLNIIPYQSIADALHISEDDVEIWVVEAISHKLIEASMDQLNKIVVIK